MEKNRKEIIRNIQKLTDQIFRSMRMSLPAEWLSSEMTVAQLRVLLILQTAGPSRMSAIASEIGTTLSTVTGTVDMLVRKGLVERKDDPVDRRLVICQLSPEGQAMMDKMWEMCRDKIEEVSPNHSPDELEEAEDLAEILLSKLRSGAK